MRVLKCPLCCGSQFNSKIDLIRHLSIYNSNVFCPICEDRFADVNQLMEHIINCRKLDEDIENTPSTSLINNSEANKAAGQLANSKNYNIPKKVDIESVPKVQSSQAELQSEILARRRKHLASTKVELFSENGETFAIVNHNGIRYSKPKTKQNPISKDKNLAQDSIEENGSKNSGVQNQTNTSKKDHQMELYSANGEKFVIVNRKEKSYHNNDNQQKDSLISKEIQNESDDDNYTVFVKESNHLSELPEIDSEVDIIPKLTEEDNIKLNLYQNGESSYVIVQNLPKDDNVITCSNESEGTPAEMDDLIESDKMVQDDTEDLYTCSTCGVSFTSVYDHIHKYHTDQDVVVEVNESALRMSTNADNTVLLDTIDEPEVKEPLPKRVITDTGKIETIQPIKTVTTETGQLTVTKLAPIVKTASQANSMVDNKGRLYTRKLVQIGKFWKKKEKLKKTKHQPTKTDKVTYHQAVEKIIDTADGFNKVKVYQCVSCNTYVKCLDDFRNQICQPTCLKYECALCTAVYDNSKSLCAHMRVHKVKEVNINTDKIAKEPHNYTCNICCTEFPTNKSLRLHIRMHDPVKSRDIIPPVKTENDVDRESNYDCELCLESIPLSYKSVHDEYHKPTTQYHCNICNRLFATNENLIMHMGIHSVCKTEKPRAIKSRAYKCIYCDKPFSRPHEKVKHERIHTGERPHKCAVCGKSFRVAYCLTLHMRTHSGDRPYECMHCGKKFKAHSVYNHHIQIHSDVRRYKCPFCPKAFKTLVQLSGHKNSHTKPFSCTVCNRRFSSLYAVRVHTDSHNRQNNLRYTCTVCGAIYARTFALKDHIKQEHSVELSQAEDLDSLIMSEISISKVGEAEPKSVISSEEQTIIENNITDMLKNNEIEMEDSLPPPISEKGVPVKVYKPARQLQPIVE